MSVRATSFGLLACGVAGLFSCSGEGLTASPSGTGSNQAGGIGAGGASDSGALTSGGALTGGAAPETSGGADGAGGSLVSGGSPSTGGSVAGAGSNPSAGGGAETGGGSSLDACATRQLLEELPSIDCGEQGVVLEAAGPVRNRVNYVIVGDGYTAEDLDGLYLDHIMNMLQHEQGMYGDLGEPYRRYRRFINVCALKVESQDGCIDDLDTGLQCDTAFDGYGDDSSRLGIVTESLVYDAIAQRLPDSVDVDWIGVTINAGSENWWNSGGAVMVWNGGFEPQNNAASVALHEGGHAFHGLADEYDGDDQNCSMAPELNVSTSDDGAKWAEWLDFDHTPGTGLHGVFEGARYCAAGVYRPTRNSEMNQLPDYFNMPSIQKIIHDIYEVVDPIDNYTPNSAQQMDPEALAVRVVDPDVISLEWSVDGEVVTGQDSECFSAAGLEPGEHVVQVRAFDATPWVRDSRDDLEQVVSWSVSIGQP